MCRAQCVLAVVALYMGVAHSWDFAVSLEDQLIFHTSDGTETDRVHIKYRNLGGLAYDVVYNRMLYVDKQNNNDAIFGYNLTSKENECLIERSGRNILSIAYDPATEKLFFTDANEKSINWISLKRRSINNKYGNLLIKMDDRTPDDITVDSCAGYIYWTITEHTETMDIERARFDGSEREFLYYSYGSYNVNSLTINLQTQKIYYLDYYFYVVSLTNADMGGRNQHVNFVNSPFEAKELTVSKDYFYFVNTTRGENYKSVLRFPKYADSSLELKELSKFYTDGSLGLAANYKIEDQIKGRLDCDSLSNLIPTIIEAPVNTGERCDVCVNYCLHGNCSVNNEGLPKCSCNAGYLGERCEVSACYGYCQNDGECFLNKDSLPACQCKGDYSGDRCHINNCLNYCFQGNCSLSDEGHPTCSCNAGYSGERCEVSACYGYCLNDGECSLNEEDDPVCQCAGNHEGARCEADVTDTTPTNDLAKRNLTVADLLSIWGKRASRTFVSFEMVVIYGQN